MGAIKNKIKNNSFSLKIIMFFRRLFRKNVIKKIRGNVLHIQGMMKGACIKINGKNNQVEIKKAITNLGLTVFINGSNNKVTVEENCVLKNLCIWIEDDNNEVFIGKNTLICGETKLSCIESTRISIGEDCMFSNAIDVRTGDSHSILDENGKRINPSKDVIINDHVWIGHGVTILKGATVSRDSICATKAVVTKEFTQPNVVIAGNPAKIIKENINWDKARLPIE